MILILGGTKESHDICDYLLSHNIDFILSVATDYALQTFEAYKENIIMGRIPFVDFQPHTNNPEAFREILACKMAINKFFIKTRK